MKIIVEKIIMIDGKPKVDFTTEYGKSSAKWAGEIPEVGREYFVELEIGESLVIGTTLNPCDENKFAIGMKLDAVVLIGYLESIEADGYAILRLGDSIVSIELKGVILPGTFVKVISDEVTLFDLEY
ncbi:hypothetical protein [Paenibacillus sp. HB172176]|uniref:hypothetical protein n=1 Tax=Paenibacillus sp. HB172176 TaxID=2493690 RepID=UPI00143977D7|nr:hypothetical protein [Paenibacillus sp. HB172176]